MSAVEYDDNQETGGQKKGLQFCGLGDVDCLLVSDTATHFWYHSISKSYHRCSNYWTCLPNHLRSGT